MRKFYQIYCDNFGYLTDDSKVRMMTILQTQLNCKIDSLTKDDHQFIVRFKFIDDHSREELKIGNNFIQISSERSYDRCNSIFNKINTIIDKYNEEDDIDIPF